MARIENYESKSLDFRARIMPDGTLRPKEDKEAMLAAAEDAQLVRRAEERRRERETKANPQYNHFAAHVENLEREIAIAPPLRAVELGKGLDLARAQAAKHDARVAAEREAERINSDPNNVAAREYIAKHRADYSAEQVAELEALASVWQDEPLRARTEVIMRGGDFIKEQSERAAKAHADARSAALEAQAAEARASVAALEAAHAVKTHE